MCCSCHPARSVAPPTIPRPTGPPVVSALSVSPQRRRLGLLFDILDHNLTAEDFELFVARLLRKIRGPVTLVIDRLGAHRSAVRSLQAKYGLRLLLRSFFKTAKRTP
jgi:hypothetical protein